MQLEIFIMKNQVNQLKSGLKSQAVPRRYDVLFLKGILSLFTRVLMEFKVLIVETYAIRFKHTCKLASAASLRIFCYINWIKILLGQDSKLFAMFPINAGFLPQSCHKVRFKLR